MNQTVPNPAIPPVLLIEDEPGVMAYVRAVLERSGYPVVATDSGAEALRILQSGEFLGVVSDMRTPGGVDGAQVHAWISANRPELASKIVFITGDLATTKRLRPCGRPARPASKNRSVSVISLRWSNRLWGKVREQRRS